MARRAKKQDAGVPEWVVTFGDMMSLLLCFFILLQMFSELKKDHEYQRVITAVKEAFGYSGGVGILPIKDPPVRSIIEQLEEIAVKQESTPHTSESPEESVEGPHLRVTKVREGLVFTLGGPTTFDPESAEVKPAARPEIEKVATLLAGRENKIVIRGHAANKYLAKNSSWQDLYQLSYARARNVLDILTASGIDERLCRIEAVGRWEPFKAGAVGTINTAENRRVEVILTEVLAEELAGN
ncbi:MAG: OmpA/MotB family protein [Phycisphaerales bacterium]